MIKLQELAGMNLAELDALEEQVIDLLDEIDKLLPAQWDTVEDERLRLLRRRRVINRAQICEEAVIAAQARSAIPWCAPNRPPSA